MTSEEKTPANVAPAPAGVASEAEPKVSKPAPAVAENNDDDLDDLDDLLDDFAEDVLSKPPGTASASAVDEALEAGEKSVNPVDDEFKTKIDDLIKDLNIEDPDTKDQFEKLVREFDYDADQAQAAAADPNNFDSVMKDAVNRLRSSGKNIDEQLKNDSSSLNPEDLLTQLLAGMGGAEGGAGGDFDMSKLLVDMLEQLSSKEVLYEPIKDLNTKFPDFLKEKKGQIPDDQHANYTKQYEITNDILAVFEAPGYNDDNKEKRDHVNTLLESLQELGQPPTELVGDAGDFPGFGGLGGASGDADLGFSDKDLPPDLEKQLEDGCKQA